MLDSVMSYIKQQGFAQAYIYSDIELCAIMPSHVLEWINVKTFGKQNPAVDSNPISARSSSLKYWKKAISFSFTWKKKKLLSHVLWHLAKHHYGSSMLMTLFLTTSFLTSPKIGSRTIYLKHSQQSGSPIVVDDYKFLQLERRKLKHKYCCQNVIWSMVESMVQG
jgi:hypothetical protein